MFKKCYIWTVLNLILYLDYIELSILIFAQNLSFLKEKSVFNFQAAKVLIDEHDCYAPSVHCSYYGVFQMISYTLNKLGHTYEKVASDITSSKGTRMPKGSHTYPIDLIHQELTAKYDIFYAKGITDKIKLLKTFRTNSDYSVDQILKGQSEEALRMGNEIVKVLKEKL